MRSVKMTSSPVSHLFMCLTLSKNFQRYHGLWYSCVRKYAKKYDYNLNDLIDWKKNTNLAFGSPRKPTKTGKLRKSKINEDKQLQTTLEMLSAQSIHLSRSTWEMNYEFVDAPHAKHDPSEKSEKPAQGLNETDTDEANSSESCDEIFGHERDIAKAPYRNWSNDLQQQQASFETTNNFFDLSEQSPNKKRTYIERKTNDDEIHIPVISPIPSGNNNMMKSYNSVARLKTPKSNQKQFQSKKLPSEPPKSFDVINEIPLKFNASMVSEELNDKIFKFKEDVESLSLRSMPSVKSILNKTMPDLNRFFLNRWREGMIKELGEEGFKKHQDETIKRGINFHANVMELLSGKPVSDIQIMPDNEGHWASLQTAMKHISGVEALEEDGRHSALIYRGVFDCLAKYKDVLCIIDWKTSKKPRPLLKNTYDDPIQVAAYIGLANANMENLSKFGDVNHGLLAVIYPDGSPAHIHVMNPTLCEQYWKDWCGRLYQYYQLVHTEKFGSV